MLVRVLSAVYGLADAVDGRGGGGGNRTHGRLQSQEEIAVVQLYSARRNVTPAVGNASRSVFNEGSVSVPHMRVMIQVCPSSTSGYSK